MSTFHAYTLTADSVTLPTKDANRHDIIAGGADVEVYAEATTVSATALITTVLAGTAASISFRCNSITLTVPSGTGIGEVRSFTV